MKRDERIMRFLTVKMEKDHLAYAEKRRSKMGQAKPVEA
jgi:small subunit ribosomal protein S6